jgi:hypothetical protein
LRAAPQKVQEPCFLGRYFDPPLTDEQRRLADPEGWILGVSHRVDWTMPGEPTVCLGVRYGEAT